MGWVAIALLLASAPARAQGTAAGLPSTRESRIAVAALGSCDSPLIPPAADRLRAELEQAGSGQVLSEQAVAAPASSLGRASLARVRQSIEDGRGAFLALRFDAAEKHLLRAMAEVPELPLGPERWEAWCSVRAHMARLLQYRAERTRASELLLEILRVQEDFTLDRLEFPPSTRELLELSRSLLVGMPRFVLKVTTPAPGATVYLNGFALGRTPLERRLPAGHYELVVGDAHRHTLVRHIAFAGDTELRLDVEQEARFQPEGGPCWDAGEDRKERLARALTLARLVDADAVVALWVTRPAATDFLAASYFDVRRQAELREARVRIDEGAQPDVGRLARLVLGQESASASAGAFPDDSVLLLEYTSLDALQAAELSAPRGPPGEWRCIAAWSLAGIAAVLGGAAIYQQVQVGKLAKRQADLTVPGTGGAIRLEDAGRLEALRQSQQHAARRRTGYALAGGAVAVGSGLFFVISLTSRGLEPGPETDPERMPVEPPVWVARFP